MNIKVLLVHVALHNGTWVCCAGLFGCFFFFFFWKPHACSCVHRWMFLHICIFYFFVLRFLFPCKLFRAHTERVWLNVHADALFFSVKAYRIFTLLPEESHLFLSLQLGETNRPVMQQWEALNAKHIIREEGSERRRRRRSRVGGKQRTEIEKKNEKKEQDRMQYSQKWQMKD